MLKATRTEKGKEKRIRKIKKMAWREGKAEEMKERAP
jgi:hypothetical protein